VKKTPRWVKTALLILATLFAIRAALFLIPYKNLKTFTSKQNSTRFYDRNGVLLQVLPLEQGLRREYLPLKEIPVSVQQSFIQAEDKNFYIHPGVDFISIVRAAAQNKKQGRIVSGASTITMQLVRLINPREKNQLVTLKIKFLEMCSAIHLDAKLSKKKILELYLNNVPFGFQTEGVASASRTFYGTEVASLSEEQIKELSQIPRRPSEYAPEKKYVYAQKCPHFINYVTSQYKNKNEILPNSLRLSIDSELVANIENSIQQKLNDYKNARIQNGSAFVINNHTGEIFAWVGNGNFYDEHGGQIDGVLVRNQPGSSMKPFLYAEALDLTIAKPSEYNFYPTTILPDIPQDFGSSKVYVPLNFNNRYNGPVRFRVALASSLNIPAVYLLYNIGVTQYMSLLSELGFSSLDGERGSTGLSIALGSSEVTLYEMVHAFSVFPNDGNLLNINFLADDIDKKYSDDNKNKVKIISSAEKLFYKNNTIQKKVYSSDASRIICDMLSDSSARSLGFGHANVFETKYPCMFKTGTSNQFQNIIALGATTEFTAGVWLGNFEGETVIKQTGSSIPASIVRQILDYLTEQFGAGNFKQPAGFEKQEVCTLSGLSPTDVCPSTTKEYVKKTIDGKRGELKKCDYHYKNNSQVQIRYPSEYQHWASGKNMAGTISSDETEINFLYPKDGAEFVFDPTVPQNVQSLRVQAYGGVSSSAELFVDDISFGIKKSTLFWNVPLAKGSHLLRIECGGEEKTISYTVR